MVPVGKGGLNFLTTGKESKSEKKKFSFEERGVWGGGGGGGGRWSVE